jgi:hypothetical protein
VPIRAHHQLDVESANLVGGEAQQLAHYLRRAPLPPVVPGLSFGAAGLKQVDAKHWQQPLQDSGKANQCHQDLQQICQSSVANKAVDQIEANRADDDDDQDVYEDKQHLIPLPLLTRFPNMLMIRAQPTGCPAPAGHLP